MNAVFGEFALLLLISAAAGAAAMWLRQPVLMAYIVVGIVAGPAVLGLVKAHDQIDLLAQIGVTVLLFVVGLKLDLQHVRHIGPVALATGLGQLTFSIVIGFLLILALGKGAMEALYVAVALTFSSTIIIVKLLSDKREIDALHGRIAVGFLIVQDFAVVLAMIAMSVLRGGAEVSAAAAPMQRAPEHPQIMVFGLGRYGSRLAAGLQEAGLDVLGVDFDPEVARDYRRRGIALRFGDATDADFLESLPLADASWVVSTFPDLESNRGLIQALRAHHFRGEIAVVARDDNDGPALKRLGVPTVLYPSHNAVDYVVNTLLASYGTRGNTHETRYTHSRGNRSLLRFFARGGSRLFAGESSRRAAHGDTRARPG